MWFEVPKIILRRSNHTLAAVLKLIDLQLPKENETWALSETEKLSNEISVNLLATYILFNYLKINGYIKYINMKVNQI